VILSTYRSLLFSFLELFLTFFLSLFT
jgi:hypothetical protein